MNIEKRVRKMAFDKILSLLENQKSKVQTKGMYLDVFNSGVIVDIERIRRASVDLAVRVVRMVQDEMESNTRRT
jgi:hypothetical protein